MILKIIFIIYLLIPFLLKSENFTNTNKRDKEEFNFSKTKIYEESANNILWKNERNIETQNIIWEEEEENNEILGNESFINKNYYKELNIKAFDRSVSVNFVPYPEISHYVPNGFVESDQKLITTSFRALSKLRFCDSPNFDTKCADGFLNMNINVFTTENFSFYPKFSLQSISNRGTPFGEESSLGFKFAKKLSPKWSMAFGGENVIHLDKNIDMGRNFYIVASTFYEFQTSNKTNPPILFANFGIGTDFYGYKGNGFLGTTSCLGRPTLTGNGTEKCSIGPIGSIAVAFNDRVSLVNEWFGYGYGTGISLKPYKDIPLIFSIYATDYIKGFPVYIDEHCPRNSCSPRFYGNISVSF